ncbi:MAG: hypothetical protein LBG87_07580 [Spirochaetaceae bacterium]|nr:hypothetical protein [Spirochaetaceae bacterium]
MKRKTHNALFSECKGDDALRFGVKEISLPARRFFPALRPSRLTLRLRRTEPVWVIFPDEAESRSFCREIPSIVTSRSFMRRI